MRTLYYIKTTLKEMFSSMFVIAANFIIFPIIIACFLGFIENSASDNPLKLKETSISIVDEDNSEMSMKLKDTLGSEELSDFIKIEDKDADFELKIEKGYQDNVLALKEGSIIVNKNIADRELAAETIKVILDNYHKNLYGAISGKDISNLNTILNSEIIDNITIDKLENKNTYEEMATSMIGFVISFLIIGFVQTSYADKSVSLDKRMCSLPVTKFQTLIYDSIGTFIYTFIIITSYVMFFRIADLGFRGGLISLLILVSISSLLVTTIVKSISTVFGKKYGTILGTFVFAIPLVSGDIFGVGVEKMSNISPIHYLKNAFKLYNLNGNLQGCSKWIIIIVTISIAIYCTAIAKVILSRRFKNAFNKINFNKYKKTA